MNTFVGSVPYAVDVARLKEKWPVPALAEGLVIAHDDLERVVSAKRGTARYYGVVNSWIAQMKNSNGIYMIWQMSVGVKVLDPSELLTHAETVTRQKIGQTGRAIRTFGWVDRSRLDTTGQKRLDHQMRVASAIKESLAGAKRELAIEIAPVKSLPKRVIAIAEKESA